MKRGMASDRSTTYLQVRMGAEEVVDVEQVVPPAAAALLAAGLDVEPVGSVADQPVDGGREPDQDGVERRQPAGVKATALNLGDPDGAIDAGDSRVLPEVASAEEAHHVQSAAGLVETSQERPGRQQSAHQQEGVDADERVGDGLTHPVAGELANKNNYQLNLKGRKRTRSDGNTWIVLDGARSWAACSWIHVCAMTIQLAERKRMPCKQPSCEAATRVDTNRRQLDGAEKQRRARSGADGRSDGHRLRPASSKEAATTKRTSRAANTLR